MFGTFLLGDVCFNGAKFVPLEFQCNEKPVSYYIILYNGRLVSMIILNTVSGY